MNNHFRRLQPKACFEYASAEKSVQSQLNNAIGDMLDMNTGNTEIFQQMLFVSAPNDQMAYFIKDKEKAYWIDTKQVTAIYPEYEEVFQAGFSACGEWAHFYKEKTGCNIVILYADVYVNIWTYCFLDPSVDSLDSDFVQKYVGEVLDNETTVEILTKLYD